MPEPCWHWLSALSCSSASLPRASGRRDRRIPTHCVVLATALFRFSGIAVGVCRCRPCSVRLASHWAELFPAFKVEAASLAEDLGQLLRQRMVSQFEEDGFPIDLVQAVSGEGVTSERLLQDPVDARERLLLLQQLRSDGQLQAVQAVVQRASRLAEKGDLLATQLTTAEVIDAGLFDSPSEAGLLAALESLSPWLKPVITAVWPLVFRLRQSPSRPSSMVTERDGDGGRCVCASQSSESAGSVEESGIGTGAFRQHPGLTKAESDLVLQSKTPAGPKSAGVSQRAARSGFSWWSPLSALHCWPWRHCRWMNRHSAPAL